MTDPASLQNLHDIVLPGAVPWWPPAPGWYAVGAFVLLLAGWIAWRSWRRWRRDRYRRAALAELGVIRQAGPDGACRLPALLKRTALAAWPRDRVGALFGPEWHQFLDETAGLTEFRGVNGDRLDRLAYDPGGEPFLSGEALGSLLDASEKWIRSHRVEAN